MDQTKKHKGNSIDSGERRQGFSDGPAAICGGKNDFLWQARPLQHFFTHRTFLSMGDREIGVPVAQDTVLKAFESALEVRRAGCEPPPCPQPTCPATLDRGLRPSAKTTGTVSIELLCWRRKLPGPFLPDCATIRHTGAPGVPQVAQNGVRDEWDRYKSSWKASRPAGRPPW